MLLDLSFSHEMMSVKKKKVNENFLHGWCDYRLSCSNLVVSHLNVRKIISISLLNSRILEMGPLLWYHTLIKYINSYWKLNLRNEFQSHIFPLKLKYDLSTQNKCLLKGKNKHHPNHYNNLHTCFAAALRWLMKLFTAGEKSVH